MSADIERHDFRPSSQRADRCADCYCPADHGIHGGRRPAKCRMTGPHAAHAGCKGIDFPERPISPDTAALDAIALYLNTCGDWDADAINRVVGLVRQTGRDISDEAAARLGELVGDVVDLWQYRE